MKITVSDCLKLDAFNPSIVAAGKRGLSNRVRSVSVMDAVDLKTAVENNGVREQMVLTSFYGMKGNEALQTEVVRELAKCGVSALVVFHAKNGITAADADILEAAESMALPLILIPNGNESEYSDAIEQVMDKILYGDNFKNSLVNNTIYHLLNFEKYTSFQTALREAAVNNEFQAVLLSKDFNPILVIETRHKITVSEAVRKIKERKPEKSGIYSMVDVDGVLTYWGTINIGREKYFMLIVDNEDNYSAGELTKLAEIIELAAGMWKFTPERDVKTEFIKALIRGNKSLAYSLKDEMSIEPGALMSVFYAKGIDNTRCRDIISGFEEEENYEVLRIFEGEEIYGIVMKCGSDAEDGSGKLTCLKLYDGLKGVNKGVRIFHCTGIDGIEGAADAFKLISETWTFVESVFPYKRVFTKYELVLASNCINIQVQGGYIKKNYVELLEPFSKEMGENKARQLLDTLETFVLDAGMNSGKTSEFMGIHTNTVQYRLKKINEVLGAEITGNRVIPGLTIALALKRLERVVN
jgi:hypothetical protein